MSKQFLNYAILGTSFISAVMADAIKKSTYGKIRCVGSRTRAHAMKFAQEHGIEIFYDDLSLALSDPEVDVVFIGLPTGLHAEYTVLAAQANKHILCEKSFTINAQEARRALEVVKNTSVFFMEAQMYRCHPIVGRFKEVVQGQPLGKPLFVQAKFTAPIINLFNRTAGGSILDLGCYPISLLRYLFGEPLRVLSSASKINHPAEGDTTGANAFDEWAECTFEMVGGVKATVKSNNNDMLQWEFVVHCEQGTIALSNLWESSVDDAIIICDTDAQVIETIVMNLSKTQNFYSLQIDTVNKCVLHNEKEASPPAMNWQDTINNMIVLDQWRSAIGLSYPVDVEEM